ncbi:hypothetical protein ACOMHN_058589 [Nucella lapillus]
MTPDFQTEGWRFVCVCDTHTPGSEAGPGKMMRDEQLTEPASGSDNTGWGAFSALPTNPLARPVSETPLLPQRQGRNRNRSSFS